MNRRNLLKATTAVGIGWPVASAASSTDGSEQAVTAFVVREGPRETILLDAGWRFHRDDIAAPPPRTGDETYASTKAGGAAGAASIKFDDSAWRSLDLPHDFVVEGPFLADENVAQGYRPKGVGWYRKTLTLGLSDRNKHIELQIDGIATTATIWINGNIAAHNLSGYSSSYVDLTPFLNFGAEPNVIAIRVDSSEIQGWWYEGGGLYRHVWLVKREPVHVITDGVYAHPRRSDNGQWHIPVEVTLNNIGETQAQARIDVALLDGADKVIAIGHGTAKVDALAQGIAACALEVADPQLWSIDFPTLYRVRIRVVVADSPVDETNVTVGFRTAHFDPERGFLLNGVGVKIKGVCIHQDHAGLGVALPDAMIDYRLRLLKELGCNAIRSSHNAPTRELLDAADRMGFLIMDENRLFNPSPDYVAMLEWLVRRDRNHPSVILWSVFNEEPLQGTRKGYEMVRRLVAAVKRLDDSRPVTAAMNNGTDAPQNVSQAVDVVGFNYQPGEYDRFHAANPGKPITSSEDTSAVMTRGEYESDRKGRHVLASYDDEAQPWGATHRHAWKEIATRPFVAGCFVWTGFDYRGEPQPFEWPTVSSSFGIMDLCGFPKAAYFIHQAQWVTDRPILHIVPHWNWQGREGRPIRIMVMSNAERLVLRLNGKIIGEQKVDPFEMNEWHVPYEPGVLEAVAMRAGKVVARQTVETSGAPAALRLQSDRKRIVPDGRDTVPITVEALDGSGRPIATANLPVQFEIVGGRIIGVGNGDANSHEPEKANKRSLYNGLAQVIVQSAPGAGRYMTLRATAAGLRPAEIRLGRI